MDQLKISLHLELPTAVAYDPITTLSKKDKMTQMATISCGLETGPET